MKPGMRLVCVGCGDAFSALYYSSCLAVESGGEWVLIDCPHPIRKILREAGTRIGRELDISTFSAHIITHLHADHASGLEGLGFFSYFALGRKARVYAHGDVLEPLWEGKLRLTMGRLGVAGDDDGPGESLSTYFEIGTLSEGSAARLGTFEVDCRRTVHPIPTFALKLRAGGACLGYSADTSFDRGLIEWLEPADLIVHETNAGIHTPYEALLGLPAALREKMRLIHYPDEFDVERSEIEALRQGCAYEIVGR
jgi:ribonuclease BN (tRNA processing enzyme)